MRSYGLTLAAVLLAIGQAWSQQVPPQQQPVQQQPVQQQPVQQPQQPAAALNPATNRLDALLLQWEQQMRSLQTLEAACTRTTLDKVIGNTEVFEGTAKYMKPNLAVLEMRKKNKPEVFEKFVCSGTFLYEYSPQNKAIRVHELPPPKPGQVADDNFLSFLFGMRAEEAKRRYELSLVKEDAHYVYIGIVPRFPQDKADFQRARLVLLKRNFLPRQLWFEAPNGNEITWDIPQAQQNTPLNRNEFTVTAPPPGWNLVRVASQQNVQPNPQPRVVRPQQ